MDYKQIEKDRQKIEQAFLNDKKEREQKFEDRIIMIGIIGKVCGILSFICFLPFILVFALLGGKGKE
jgi:hypothetical protein